MRNEGVRIVLMPRALLAAWLMCAACGSTGEPPLGYLWRAQEVELGVLYDTLPSADETPLAVHFDTLRTESGHMRLWASVTATNRSNRRLVGETGGACHWRFTAYDNPKREGEPVWSREDGICRLSAMPFDIEPGAQLAFPRTGLGLVGDLTETRGPGTYYFAARLWGKLGDDGPWQWLTGRLPAGSLVLVP
jgi:hypothetical protein